MTLFLQAEKYQNSMKEELNNILSISEEIFNLPSIPEICKACKNTYWWCRGCHENDKRYALEQAGYDQEKIELIINYQNEDCSEDMIPCFLCNQNGLISLDEDDTGLNNNFWKI